MLRIYGPFLAMMLASGIGKAELLTISSPGITQAFPDGTTFSIGAFSVDVDVTPAGPPSTFMIGNESGIFGTPSGTVDEDDVLLPVTVTCCGGVSGTGSIFFEVDAFLNGGVNTINEFSGFGTPGELISLPLVGTVTIAGAGGTSPCGRCVTGAPGSTFTEPSETLQVSFVNGPEPSSWSLVTLAAIVLAWRLSQRAIRPSRET